MLGALNEVWAHSGRDVWSMAVGGQRGRRLQTNDGLARPLHPGGLRVNPWPRKKKKVREREQSPFRQERRKGQGFRSSSGILDMRRRSDNVITATKRDGSRIFQRSVVAIARRSYSICPL